MDKYDIILKNAEKEMFQLNHPYVGTEHLLLAILKENNKLTQHLKEKNLTYKKFKNKLISIIGTATKKSKYILYTPMLRSVLKDATDYSKEKNQEIDEVVLFNSIIRAKEGIAIRILMSLNMDIDKLYYNDVEMQYGIILNNQKNIDDIIGRDKEISEIIQILLRKNKCNPLLIGKAGVGKTAIVEYLAKLIEKEKVPKELLKYKILKVDLASMISGARYRGDFEEKITNLINQVIEEKNIILFIDEVHTIIDAGGAEGAISAGDILKPFLARGELKLIGATTLNEYHKFITKDSALNRRFQNVLIEEPSLEETKIILNKAKESYEKFHRLKINNLIIDEIINVTNTYLKNKANPDKSLELLDSLCSYVKYCQKNTIEENDIYDLLNSKYHINFLCKNFDSKIGKIIKDNKCLIVHDIEKFKEFVKYEYNSNLFVDINLNDYTSDYSNQKLLGYHNTEDRNYLLRQFIDNPFGVISLKNFKGEEELNPIILKMIKERYIVDNYGNEIDLSNAIILVDENVKTNKIGFTCSKENKINSQYFIKWELKNPIIT